MASIVRQVQMTMKLASLNVHDTSIASTSSTKKVTSGYTFKKIIENGIIKVKTSGNYNLYNVTLVDNFMYNQTSNVSVPDIENVFSKENVHRNLHNVTVNIFSEENVHRNVHKTKIITLTLIILLVIVFMLIGSFYFMNKWNTQRRMQPNQIEMDDLSLPQMDPEYNQFSSDSNSYE